MIYSTEVTKYNHNKPEQLNRFEELIIIERNDGTVFEFMKNFSNHEFVIKLDNIQQFLDNNTINSYDNFLKENPKIHLKFCFYRSSEYGQQLRKLMIEHKQSYFYADYVRSWDTLNGYISEGVTDVYIVEEMGFSLPLVWEVSEGVRIRVIPHVAQSNYLLTDSIMKFFIRPDDVDIYEQYVDVFEILNIQNPNSSATMVKIYKDKGWAGKLSEIISDFNDDLDNRNLLSIFGQVRLTCNKRCMKGGSCNVCKRYRVIANTIETKGFLNDKYNEYTNPD